MATWRVIAWVGLTPLILIGCTTPDRSSADQGASTPASTVPEGCPASAADDPPAPVRPAAALSQAESCADVTAAVQAQALAEMNATLDRNLKQALTLRCQPCAARPVVDYPSGGGGGGGFGCGASYSEAAGIGYQDAGVMMIDAAAAPAAAADGGAASEYSTTNNQVAGVDEPDFIKNDGSTIYIVAHGALRIIDAWPPEQAHTLSTTPIEGTPTGLFVYADRAVVYTQLGGAADAGSDCTYGYLCQFKGTPGPWAILVYDISDKTAPQRVRRLEMDAGLVSSRRIGNIVHSVMVFADGAQPPPTWQEWPTELPSTVGYCAESSLADYSVDELKQRFADLRAANTSAIAAWRGTYTTPTLSDGRAEAAGWVDDTQALASCRGFYVSGTGRGAGLLALVSFDLTAAAPVNVTAVVSQPGAVYATTQSLYVAPSDVQESSWSYSAPPPGERTAIHKFSLTDNSVATTYVGSGEIDGHVLSQFSLDEKDGYLRIATSLGWVRWDSNVSSLVAVFAQDVGTLSVVGQLDGIAPGEDIRSVLFDGDVAYVVTFRQTDPLFVVDLSNPLAPTLKSELQVPGFSTYMQMLDPSHVLAIGFDAEDMGGYSWFRGIKLQIFDVSDPYNPRQLHQEVIGTSGTTSEAATNHLAFNYFAPKEALALPIAICVGASGSGETYGTTMTFDGLLVYNVDVTAGFTRLGGLPLVDPSAYGAYGSACMNWWADPNSGVKRSVFMDDYVWAIGADVIRVATLADLAQPVASVSLK